MEKLELPTKHPLFVGGSFPEEPMTVSQNGSPTGNPGRVYADKFRRRIKQLLN